MAVTVSRPVLIVEQFGWGVAVTVSRPVLIVEQLG